MTLERIDFYLLSRGQPEDKLAVTCRLAKKAYARGMTTYIRTPDTATAERLDDLLWTFEQGGFIPHRRDRDGDEPAPVLIGCDPPQDDPPDVLISLGGDIPGNFTAYRRIAEVIGNTDEDKLPARKRYRIYQEQACTPDTHSVSP